ncbi:hypothetical protein [Piscinibacter gummiphilus]|uniref:Uncharacterized protein n=1 Tax=Piscinibacter gummiphilus TaxID=946333 RepID=A0A1W6L961_9BURK|nr:hypothetical protein [Piscinibacter gummiphilus]ARN20782.1 hypothetical protein A4W93_13230 [Piscinibacter gummiphilus]ATU65456.1 hypothetical protein CPZ87_13310 [Piscinibacter gummiphilus]GLS94612.1 hypothetical protein GCM10007918_19040 [Piscinibacter gummiphilus]
MADNAIRSLRVLADIRRRRGKALEKALADQRAAMDRCVADTQSARERRDDTSTRHEQALDGRTRLFEQAFTPAHVKAADIAIETCAAEKAEAEKVLRRCESSEQRQAQEVTAAQAAVRRNNERIERFDARIAAALAGKQSAEDEAADEEAEEMASARIGGRRRAAREAAEHA